MKKIIYGLFFIGLNNQIFCQEKTRLILINETHQPLSLLIGASHDQTPIIPHGSLKVTLGPESSYEYPAAPLGFLALCTAVAKDKPLVLNAQNFWVVRFAKEEMSSIRCNDTASMKKEAAKKQAKL